MTTDTLILIVYLIGVLITASIVVEVGRTSSKCSVIGWRKVGDADFFGSIVMGGMGGLLWPFLIAVLPIFLGSLGVRGLRLLAPTARAERAKLRRAAVEEELRQMERRIELKERELKIGPWAEKGV